MATPNREGMQAFIGEMRRNAAFQEGFRRHMGQTMRGMDGDIMAMQKAMNERIARGFLGYAREAGFAVEDADMEALLRAVNEGLHQKMGEVFRQEFAAAIGKLMRDEQDAP